jgi:mono/diheme cytochrome c family protein
MTLRRLLPVSVLLAMAACGGGEPQAEEEAGPTPEDSVAMAAAAYDPSNYDSIQWEAPADAVVRGSVVFSYSCAKCHGRQGYGDGEFVSQGDTLYPPSFHDPEWRFSGDVDGLREQIYTGTPQGMPHWGLEGLKYRDIDAVSRFILVELRDEGEAGDADEG